MEDSTKPVIPDIQQTKPKRRISEDQLAKLKVAREKALKVKQQMKQNSDEEKIKHYEEKISRIKTKSKAKEEPNAKVEAEVAEPLITEELPSTNLEPTPKPVKPSKPAKAKKPVVIYEQSDSESSDDNSNVVYIKKGRSRNKKQEPLPPTQSAPPSALPPAPLPQRQILINPNPLYRHNLMQQYM